MCVWVLMILFYENCPLLYILKTFKEIYSWNNFISAYNILFYEEDLLMENAVKWGLKNPLSWWQFKDGNKRFSQALERD